MPQSAGLVRLNMYESLRKTAATKRMNLCRLITQWYRIILASQAIIYYYKTPADNLLQLQMLPSINPSEFNMECILAETSKNLNSGFEAILHSPWRIKTQFTQQHKPTEYQISCSAVNNKNKIAQIDISTTSNLKLKANLNFQQK